MQNPNGNGYVGFMDLNICAYNRTITDPNVSKSQGRKGSRGKDRNCSAKYKPKSR